MLNMNYIHHDWCHGKHRREGILTLYHLTLNPNVSGGCIPAQFILNCTFITPTLILHHLCNSQSSDLLVNLYHYSNVRIQGTRVVNPSYTVGRRDTEVGTGDLQSANAYWNINQVFCASCDIRSN